MMTIEQLNQLNMFKKRLDDNNASLKDLEKLIELLKHINQLKQPREFHIDSVKFSKPSSPVYPKDAA